MIDLSASLRKTSYFAKDQAKASRATRFIGRGSPHSSTAAYARAAWPNANCGEYTHEDIVFISAEGARKGRLDPDCAEIAKAIRASAAFITDDPANRARPYNLGERQVAQFLEQHGYREASPGIWSPPDG